MKYSNIKTWFEGVLFDSKLELRRYFFLKNWEETGFIQGLERQVKFPLKGDTNDPKADELWKKKVYIADFCYYREGSYVVEDVKSALSSKEEVFMRKKARLRNLGINIQEVFSHTIPFLVSPQTFPWRKRSYKKRC